jgi:DNA-binding Xre family transcriptional regulator
VFKNMDKDVSVKELMNAVVLADRTLEGLKDAEDGKTINTENLLFEMRNWKPL